MRRAVHIDSIAAALGTRMASVEEAACDGQLNSSVAALREAGFRRHRTAEDGERGFDLALRAAREARGTHERVDALLYATSLPINANLGDPQAFAESGDVKHLADFPACRLQAALELPEAWVLGVDQQACTGLFGAVRVARGLFAAEPDLETALCVTADRFPPGARYEQAWALISDASVALRVTRAPGAWRVLGCAGRTVGALAAASDEELIGGFFAGALHVCQAALRDAGLERGGLHHLVLQNMDPRAGRVLASALGLDPQQVAMPSLADAAHLIGGDPFLNLERLSGSGAVAPGERALLVASGFGQQWQALLVERTGC